MEIIKSVFSPHIAGRQPPKNLQPQDNYLFEQVLSANIRGTDIVVLGHVSILKDQIFDPRHFNFYTSYTHILPVQKTARVKSLSLFFGTCHSIDQGIWITDEWSSEYFHWLTDALPRLIAADDFREGYLVILPQRYQQFGYVQQSLSLLNCQPYFYNPRKRLSVGKLLLPSHTAFTGNYNLQLIGKLRNLFLQKEKLAPWRKIFVSRQKAGKRRLLNELVVTGILFQHGYEVHFFEDYTLAAQIALLSETKILIGLHGAGLTNMLFMQAGGQIIEIRHEQDSHNNCFFSLAAALSHDYYYLTGKGNSADPLQSDLTVDIAKLMTVVAAVEKSQQP